MKVQKAVKRNSFRKYIFVKVKIDFKKKIKKQILRIKKYFSLIDYDMIS